MPWSLSSLTSHSTSFFFSLHQCLQELRMTTSVQFFLQKVETLVCVFSPIFYDVYLWLHRSWVVQQDSNLNTNHIFSRNYHQVLVLLRLRQICSHPSLIQEGGVTFVDPNEAYVNPEFATELTRACRLVSSEFVDKLKRNLRRLRWCAFKLRKRYVFWMGLNKHKLMYIPVRPRYHRGRRLSNMLRCHDGYGTRPGSRSIHGEGKDPCHVIAPQMRRSVLKSFLELSLIWPTWLLGVGLNLTRANNVISLDLGWLQAFNRVHRVGQMRKVHIQRVIADTFDDWILKMQERKVLHLSGALENIFLFVISSKLSPTAVWAKVPERRLAVSIFCLVFISSMKLISNPLRIVGKGAW